MSLAKKNNKYYIIEDLHGTKSDLWVDAMYIRNYGFVKLEKGVALTLLNFPQIEHQFFTNIYKDKEQIIRLQNFINDSKIEGEIFQKIRDANLRGLVVHVYAESHEITHIIDKLYMKYIWSLDKPFSKWLNNMIQKEKISAGYHKLLDHILK